MSNLLCILREKETHIELPKSIVNSTMECQSCCGTSLFPDEITGNLICSSCGVVQDFHNFDHQLGGFKDPQGTYISIGSSGTGSSLNYKDKKIYEAKKLIDQLRSQLNLDPHRTKEIKSMIHKLTEGEFGHGAWFPILIGACAYVIMRNDNASMSISEIASVLSCDVYDLGRMISRVVNHLDMKLPEFDIVNSFKTEFNNLSRLSHVDKEKKDVMMKQGVFLIQCSVKWFLTTGRRPLPMIAAVIVFLAQVNEVKGIKIEDIARDIHAAVHTCKLRYNEFLKALVNVAQALPWGKDVTVKNLVRNAPFVIHYMELKSMANPNEKNHSGFDLECAVSDCLRKDVEYNGQNDSQYFESTDTNNSDTSRLSVITDGDLKISVECLSVVYKKFLDDARSGKSMTEFRGEERRENYGELLSCWDWWNGKSELSKKLLLKQVLDKDVGMEVMPPSFVKGCLRNERRKEKISAAKQRIGKIMNPSDIIADVRSRERELGSRKKRKTAINDIDWEDLVIETLMLHQVGEDEIEKGHYNTLLDLHVFNSIADVRKRKT